MRHVRLSLILLLAMSLGCVGGELTQEVTLNLWDGPAPLAEGSNQADIPALQIFLPKPGTATGAAMVIFPGGAYVHLAPSEGPPVGRWFAERGILGCVVRYRIAPKYHHPAMMMDGQRAVQYVRAHAADWKVDPHRIGVIGFSAGGHLASTVSTHVVAADPKASDPMLQVSSRPDIAALIYPVITMGGAETHKGSQKNLLGNKPAPELLKLMSNDKQVTRDTPPTFLMHSTADRSVPVANSDLYAAALKAAGVPCDYLRGDLGGHGISLKDTWTPRLEQWLIERGFCAKK